MGCTAKVRPVNTLEIASHVQSTVGRCMVDAQLSASHVIEITNWSNISYNVDIHGECQTPCVGYQGPGGPRQTWNQNSWVVLPRPGSGGPPKAAARQHLTSLGAARDQSIRTDIRWVALGWGGPPRTEALGMQVDTL